VFMRLLFFALLIAPLFGYSAIVVRIKGNRCFVHLEGAAASVGDHMEALDLFGKPRGIIRLDKVKNGKAIATVLDGTVGVNWLLEHTNQTSLESAEMAGSLKKNKVGLMGSGRWIIIRKDIRETQRYQGWGGGVSLFFDWSFNEFLSLNIASGLNYARISSEDSGGRSSFKNSDILQRTSFPFLQLGLKFYIPINQKTKLWISAGGSFSKWNNINDNYYVLDKSEFKFQPIGQVNLGIDIAIPKTKYTVPISIGYERPQWGGRWFEENILEKKPKPDRISVEISEITFHIGISQPI